MVSALPVQAQSLPPPGAEPVPRIRLGPIGLSPTVALVDAGIDTNVFRERKEPKQDSTMTLRPQMEARVRIGRARFVGDAALDFVYFQQYRSERSIDTNDRVAVDIPLNRMTLSGSYSLLNTRQRLNDEIDARARRVEKGATLAADVRLGGRTSLAAGLRQATTAFDGDTVFEGKRLQQVFNRETRSRSTAVRYAVSPLATLVVAGEAEQVRFDFSPLRDGEGLRIMPGIEFKPSGLLRGRAFVGYRRFDIADSDVPDFTGSAASVDLQYVPFDTMRIAIGFERDIGYSFRLAEPYYLRSGLTASVTQVLGRSWRIWGSAGLDWREYRRRAAGRRGEAASDGVGPLERGSIYGAGVDYGLSRSTAISFAATYHRRLSSFGSRREYQLLRIGTTITYGFD